jgi:hypothetical protein
LTRCTTDQHGTASFLGQADQGSRRIMALYLGEGPESILDFPSVEPSEPARLRPDDPANAEVELRGTYPIDVGDLRSRVGVGVGPHPIAPYVVGPSSDGSLR